MQLVVVLAESGEGVPRRASFSPRCANRDARYYPYQEHDALPRHRSNSAGSSVHASQLTHLLTTQQWVVTGCANGKPLTQPVNPTHTTSSHEYKIKDPADHSP